MRIKELELIQPSKEMVEFFKKFMYEHEKGLKAIKTLAEIKEIAEDFGFNGIYEDCFAGIQKILQKINEVEDGNI